MPLPTRMVLGLAQGRTRIMRISSVAGGLALTAFLAHCRQTPPSAVTTPSRSTMPPSWIQSISIPLPPQSGTVARYGVDPKTHEFVDLLTGSLEALNSPAEIEARKRSFLLLNDPVEFQR